MRVWQCDICGKAIDITDGNHLEISRAYRSRVELCETCAGPIIEALGRFRLLPEKLLKTLEFAAD